MFRLPRASPAPGRAHLNNDCYNFAVTAQRGHGLSKFRNNGKLTERRSFSTSTSRAKALPFSLGADAMAATTQGGLGTERRGETLRMIMFGKPGAGKVRSFAI